MGNMAPLSTASLHDLSQNMPPWRKTTLSYLAGTGNGQELRSRLPVDGQQHELGSPIQKPSEGKLRNEGNSAQTNQHKRPSGTGSPKETKDDPDAIVMQPETRPISQEQLAAEVKGIYAGLVKVETKCIEVDSLQNAEDQGTARIKNEQWQALIALHRTLLHEHHDFFLASQHPSKTSQAPSRAASKHAVPAGMWRHGIHSFLELLRQGLPVSLEHMLAFIYLAYSMMALLCEAVLDETPFIECLGGLGRYRMAIEDEDIRDREIWTGVSRHWYSKASDKVPTAGRLQCPSYHEGAFVPDLTPAEFHHDHKVASMEFPQIPQTERPLPGDWSLRGLLWTDKLYPEDWFSSGGHSRRPGLYSDPFDDLQGPSPSHKDGRIMSGYLLNHRPLLSMISQKFLGLAVLAAIAIPVVSAEPPGRDVVTMAWVFGIMANVPSVYVLANPPAPPGVDGGAEEVIWKIARGWGLTFGPVFAAVLVVLLRAVLPREKRVAFIALVFAMSLVLMLMLKLFMMDDTWSVLDLLALCVSFCGVAAYIITSGPRGRGAAGEDPGLEGGRHRYHQPGLAIDQPGQPPQALRTEGDADHESAGVQSSIRSDGPFVIGDDSTLGDTGSRA